MLDLPKQQFEGALGPPNHIFVTLYLRDHALPYGLQSTA
jgi:hypothetical protein